MTDSNSTSGSDSGSKALRNTAVVCLILVVLSPLRHNLIPLIIVAGSIYAIFYAIVRLSRFSRPLGLSVIGVLAASICGYAWLLYSAETTHQKILKELSEHSGVSVGRDFFPLPHITRLSIGYGVDDVEFAEIVAVKGLEKIENLHLENELLTDACLAVVTDIPNLSFVFLDCDGISDEAILELERKLPDCRVVPFRRNLHDEPTVFLGAPTIIH